MSQSISTESTKSEYEATSSTSLVDLLDQSYPLGEKLLAHLSLRDILHLSTTSGDCNRVIDRLLETFQGERSLPKEITSPLFETSTKEMEALRERKRAALEWIAEKVPRLHADFSGLLDAVLHFSPDHDTILTVLSLTNLVQVTCYVTEKNHDTLMGTLAQIMEGSKSLKKLEIYGSELHTTVSLPPYKRIIALRLTFFERFPLLTAPAPYSLLICVRSDVTDRDTHFFSILLQGLKQLKRLLSLSLDLDNREALKTAIIRELGKNAKLWLNTFRDGTEKITGHEQVARVLAIRLGLFEAIEKGSADNNTKIRSWEDVAQLEHIRVKEITQNSFAMDLFHRLATLGGNLKSLELFQKNPPEFDYDKVEFLSIFPFDFLRLVPFLKDNFGSDYIVCVPRHAAALPPIIVQRLRSLTKLVFLSFYMDTSHQVCKEVLRVLGEIRPEVNLLGLMSLTPTLDVILLIHESYPSICSGKILGVPLRISTGYEHVWAYFPRLRLLSGEPRPDEDTQGSDQEEDVTEGEADAGEAA